MLAQRGADAGSFIYGAADVLGRWAMALWTGALGSFAFIFTPLALAVIGNLATFAKLVGRTLEQLALFGYWCGGIAAICSVIVISLTLERRREYLRLVLIALMAGLSTYIAGSAVPAMERSAVAFGGSLATLPANDPRRVSYDEQHRLSTGAFGAEFALGMIVLAMRTRRREV